MRAAFVAACAAACLLTPAVQAVDVPQIGLTSVATIATADGPAYRTETQIGSAFRLRLGVASLATATTKGDIGQRRLRLERATLDYFPFANGFRLSVGARKDGIGKGALRGFDQRGEAMSGADFGRNVGGKRRLLPGVGIGYDEHLSADTRLSFDGGMRMSRRISATSQLLRLAEASTPGGLGTRKAGFGPVARVSLIHSF